MTARLVFEPAAEQDVLEAASWYEAERAGLGGAFLDEVERLVARVAQAPSQFPVVHAGARRGLTHRFPYGVYFVASRHAVMIVAVLHLSRHPNSLKDRV